MKIDEMIDYWIEGAKDDFKTANSLFISKRYHHCLFFCHLFVEKTIKALVVKKQGEQAPYSHNLLRLAELSGIEFSREQSDLLAEITSFNIETRYDDYKRSFYKKATKKYVREYFMRAKEIYLWLKKQV